MKLSNGKSSLNEPVEYRVSIPFLQLIQQAASIGVHSIHVITEHSGDMLFGEAKC